MKNINKTIVVKYSGILLLFLLIATSCKKLIEVPANPIDQIPQSHVFADSSDIIGAMAGIYTNFGVGVGSLNFGSGQITINTGLTGDELVPQIAFGGDDVELYQNAILPANGKDGTTWTDAYKCIYQMNVCLAGISSTNAISPALKKQLLAEIKVTRALYYFNMVNTWGAVPLILSTDYTLTKSQPRAPVDTIYKQILADLTSAESNLNSNYPSAGRARPNKYVAEALLSKVYLYRGMWQQALTASNDVINSGLYSLTTDLNAVFLDGSTEALWQLPANSQYEATPEGFALLPNDGQNLSYAYAPQYALSQELISSFENGDNRMNQWTVSYALNGTNYSVAYKYKNLSSTASPTEDYMVIRLAELYLIRAEALAHTGNFTGAMADVNLIRQRAGLLPAAAISQTDVLVAIMKERRIELFCEWGNRWFDLNRTGTINTVLSAEKTGWKPTSSLFPIPITELQSNPFLTQNPGYPGAK